MRISVKALPVEDILKDLARQWKTTIKEDSGELTIELPEYLGEGIVKGTSYDSGIGVIQYNCTFSVDYEILFSINHTHPLKFIFCSEGLVDHTFIEDQEAHHIETYQNVIVSSSGNNGHILNFKANQKVHVTSIEVIREVFSTRNNHHFKSLDPVLKNLFEDSVAEKKFFYQGNYSIRSAEIVEEINDKDVEGFLKSMWVESKLLEILVTQIRQYQDDMRKDTLPQILRKSDVRKIEEAAGLIRTNLEKNYSVEELAKEVGTNVNKLQEGFKYLFGFTVNKFVQDIKLEAAKDKLSTTDTNVSEVVTAIGLKNRSYFSRIFKERYGVSPRHFLKELQRKEMNGDS